MRVLVLLLFLSSFACAQKNGSYKTSSDEDELDKSRVAYFYENGNFTRKKYFKNDKLDKEIYLKRIDIPIEELKQKPSLHSLYIDSTGIYKQIARLKYNANSDSSNFVRHIGDTIIYRMFKIDDGNFVNFEDKTVSVERMIRERYRTLDFPIEYIENGYIVIYDYLADYSSYLQIPRPYFSFLIKQYNKEGVLIPERSGLFSRHNKNRIDFSVEKKRDRYINEFILELEEIK